MNCSTMAAVLQAFVDEGDALGQLLVVLDHRRLRDAGGRLEEQRLHDQRKPELARQHGLAAGPHDREVRHRHAVVGEQLLRQRLVARQDQAARVAAGVGQAQQLQVADDVLIEGGDAGERLQQVEDDVRLERRDGGRGCRCRSSWTPRTRTSWPISRSVSMTSNSIFHSASRTSMPLVCAGRHQVVVHERQDAASSQEQPVAAAVQVVHRLHGEEHGELLPRGVFGNAPAAAAARGSAPSCPRAPDRSCTGRCRSSRPPPCAPAAGCGR